MIINKDEQSGKFIIKDNEFNIIKKEGKWWIILEK